MPREEHKKKYTRPFQQTVQKSGEIVCFHFAKFIFLGKKSSQKVELFQKYCQTLSRSKVMQGQNSFPNPTSFFI